jgi:hypothetical protein
MRERSRIQGISRGRRDRKSCPFCVVKAGLRVTRNLLHVINVQSYAAVAMILSA